MSPQGFFGSIAKENDYIKSQTEFAQYYGGYGFFGTLTTISTKSMYKLKRESATSKLSMSIFGTPVDLPLSTTLTGGWNYLGCPYKTQQPLSDSLPDLSYAENDMVKSQTVFTNYYPGYGWFGNLNTLDPGFGYKMKLNKGGNAKFPKPAGRRELEQEKPTPDSLLIVPAPKGWVVDEGISAETMTITAIVTIDGTHLSKGSLGAFVASDIRGSQSSPTVPPFGPNANKSLFLLTVYGKQNELITFKFNNGRSTVVLDKTLPFLADDNLGSIMYPIVFTEPRSKLFGSSQ